MKLEIFRTIQQKETIDIDLPYYFKYDLSDESNVVIYGKIEEDGTTIIQITEYCGKVNFELSVEERSAGHFSCYMTDEHKGSEDEYLDAKEKLLKAAQLA